MNQPSIAITFGKTDFTGASKMGFYFARAVRDAGWRIIAVCNPPPKDGRTSVNDKLRSSQITVIETSGFNRFLDLKSIRHLAGVFQEHQVEAVTSMNQSDIKKSAWAARRAGAVYAPSIQNLRHFHGLRPVRHFKAWMYALTLRRCAQRVICCSEATADETIHRFNVPPTRVQVLPNCIDLQEIPRFDSEAKEQARRRLGIAADDILLMNVGRLTEQKGQHILLEAFAQARLSNHVKLALVGTSPVVSLEKGSDAGSYAVALREQVKNLGLSDRVIFTGWRDDVPLLVSSADIYVHSALWEGLPLAVLEAMAAERPVIATDCAGRLEYFVDGENGYFVKAGSVEQLCAAMQQLLALGKHQWSAMGKRNRELVERHYDAPIIGKRYVDILAGLLPAKQFQTPAQRQNTSPLSAVPDARTNVKPAAAE
jgi:glycosyltransferase involved in cell wall biosynthesis